MNSPRLLRLHPADNVLTVVCPAEAGTRLEFEGMKMHITQPVGLGHKVAARPIAAGEKVLKYGVAIGSATRSIDAGEHAVRAAVINSTMTLNIVMLGSPARNEMFDLSTRSWAAAAFR